jgi:hypothetical protein
MAIPPKAEELDLTAVGREQALADLDRRGLAGPVGPEQPKALSRRDLQVEAGHGMDVAVVFLQSFDEKRRLGGHEA